MIKVRKAVLPVAGLGTRVLPATKVTPKEMLPVFDRPALQYIVDEAKAAGIEHFVFVTGRNKGAIEDYFDSAFELDATLAQKNKTELQESLSELLPLAGSCSFVRQQAPLGLGHAVWCARDIVGEEPFAVLLPDMIMVSDPPCLAQMTADHQAVGGNIISVEQVPRDEVSKYGIAEMGDASGAGLRHLTGMIEKPAVEDAPSNFMISGRYILQPRIFELLADQNSGAGGEIQLTDAMVRLMKEDAFHAHEFKGRTYDTGSKLGYLEAFLGLALEHKELRGEAAAIIKAFADTV